MTNREFLNAVINANVSEEIKEYAKAAIEKLDTRNASRNSKPSKVQLENAPIKEALLNHLRGTSEKLTEMDLGLVLNVTHNKAGSLARQLVAEGLVLMEEVKIPKVGKRKVYFAAPVEEETMEENE